MKQLLTYLHKQLQHVVGQPTDCLVPVVLGVPVEDKENDGEDLGRTVTYQAHDVLIVLIINSTFCHLEMGTGDTLGKLAEEWFHHFDGL